MMLATSSTAFFTGMSLVKWHLRTFQACIARCVVQHIVDPHVRSLEASYHVVMIDDQHTLHAHVSN